MPKDRVNLDELVKQLPGATSDHIQVTREKVAKSEIESAIRLFFLFEDLVSAHLLACAAIEVLHPIAIATTESSSKRSTDKLLVEALGKADAAKAREFINLPYNFFKHSSSDKELKLNFKPEFTAIMLYSASVDFRMAFKFLTPLMAGYGAWFMACHPETFPLLPPEAQKLLGDMKLSDLTIRQAIADGRELLAKHLTP